MSPSTRAMRRLCVSTLFFVVVPLRTSCATSLLTYLRVKRFTISQRGWRALENRVIKRKYFFISTNDIEHEANMNEGDRSTKVPIREWKIVFLRFYQRTIAISILTLFFCAMSHRFSSSVYGKECGERERSARKKMKIYVFQLGQARPRLSAM